MDNPFQILLVAFAISVLVWLLIPSDEPNTNTVAEGEPLDPENPRHINFIMASCVGFENAAVARYALKRFEETQGRKATSRELGYIVGLAESGLVDFNTDTDTDTDADTASDK